MVWKCRGCTLDCSGEPLVMGILNVTPDSFSDGGMLTGVEEAAEKGLRLVSEGADILDLGGESTRPGHEPVPAYIEIVRVMPVIKRLMPELKVPLSIDTLKAEVAHKALEAGAAIVNSVAPREENGDLYRVAAEAQAGFVLTHNEPDFPAVAPERAVEHMAEYFKAALEDASAAGLSPEQIVLDPGIGFAKTHEQNIAIIRGLRQLCRFGRPVLMGLSRKTFLGNLTGLVPAERDDATVAADTVSILNGASIIRVHNVRAGRAGAQVAAALREA